MIFEESGIRFQVAEGWVARAYDRSTYFTALSGAGLKGMDFVAIGPEGAWMMMEVKNFRHHHPPSPEDMAIHLSAKAADTFRGLEVTRQYLLRYAYRRWLAMLRRHLSPVRWEQSFWLQLTDRLDLEPPLIAYWLEGAQLDEAWKNQLRDRLGELTKPPLHQFRLLPDGNDPTSSVLFRMA